MANFETDPTKLRTNLVEDHLADDVNKLILASLRPEYTNTETLSATKDLTDIDYPYQVITASGADQTVKLAPEATTNHITILYNAGASNNVLGKDDSGAVTFITLAPDEWAMFVPVRGKTWKVIENRATLKKYFDSLYAFNLLLNGSFNKWTRHLYNNVAVTTLRAHADDTYGPDRWNLLTNGGATDIQDAQVAGVQAKNALRFKQVNATAKYAGYNCIFTAVDSVLLRGKTVTFQLRGLSSSTPNLRMAILEWIGTADSVTSDVVLDWTSSTYTTNNFFLAANLTVTAVSAAQALSGSYGTCSVTAEVGASCNNLIVMFWSEGTIAQNVTVDIEAAGVYLTPIVQTSWKPNSAAEEAEEAQKLRWYSRVIPGNGPYLAFGFAYSTAAVFAPLLFQTMRAAPNVLAGGAAGDWQVGYGSGPTFVNPDAVPTFAGTTPDATTILTSKAAAPFTVPQAIAIKQTNAAATILLDAEL